MRSLNGYPDLLSLLQPLHVMLSILSSLGICWPVHGLWSLRAGQRSQLHAPQKQNAFKLGSAFRRPLAVQVFHRCALSYSAEQNST